MKLGQDGLDLQIGENLAKARRAEKDGSMENAQKMRTVKRLRLDAEPPAAKHHAFGVFGRLMNTYKLSSDPRELNFSQAEWMFADSHAKHVSCKTEVCLAACVCAYCWGHRHIRANRPIDYLLRVSHLNTPTRFILQMVQSVAPDT